MNQPLTKLELDVLHAVLRDEVPHGEALRAQIPFLTVASRRRSARGFYTDFAVGEGATRAALDRGHMGDVVAVTAQVPSGIHFVAFVKGGFLSLLEGYTFDDEELPADVASYALRRVNEVTPGT